MIVNATDPGPDWTVGPAPFGNYLGGSYDPAGYFNYQTLWDADGSDGDDLWVRQSIDLTGFDLDSIRWDLGVDNGYKLYINGTLVSSENAEGCGETVGVCWCLCQRVASFGNERLGRRFGGPWRADCV